MQWLGTERFMRILGCFALIAFPFMMLERGPVHAWGQWKWIFWNGKDPDEQG